MMCYEFRCKECDFIFQEWENMDSQYFPPCPACGGESRKKFSLAGLSVVHQYYSPSLGKWVQGRHHLKELRKQVGEEYTERVGIEMTVGGDSV